MERIFLVRNDELGEVNSYLEKGARVKSIHAVSEVASSYGYATGDWLEHDKGVYLGDVCAYVVLEFN